jgi:hypothetical protein
MAMSRIVIQALTFGSALLLAVPGSADTKSPTTKPDQPKLSCTTVKEWVCTAKPGGGGKLSDCHWETSQECTVVRSALTIK